MEAISLGAYDAKGLSAYETVCLGAYEAISLGAYDAVGLSAYEAVCLGAYRAISLGAYDAIGLSAYETVRLDAYEAITVYAAAKANLAKGGGAGRKEEGIDQMGGWVEKKRDQRSQSSTSSHMNAREACRIGMRERRIPRVSRLKLKPAVLESVRGAPTSPAGRVVWAKDDSATERFDFLVNLALGATTGRL